VHAFDQQIDQIAATLAALGDPDRHDLRRAKAVGVIADPQTTLDLLHHHPDHPDPDHQPDHHDGDPDHQPDGEPGNDEGGHDHPDDGGHDGGDGDDSGGVSGRPGADGSGAGAAAGGARARPRPRGSSSRGGGGGRRRVAVYVHLSEAALAARSGIARVEDLGPATLELVRDWLGRPELGLTLTPVLDLDDRAAVDAYQTPDRIRETVLLRQPCCPFPWCANLSRRQGHGPHHPLPAPRPGRPTRPDRRAPARLPLPTPHRYKTTGGWTYTMPEPGLYLWRSPFAHRYLVDHTGTTTITHPADPPG
jgi:hypothetical protein